MSVYIRLIRNNIKSNSSYGKYFAKAVSQGEVTLEDIAAEACRNSGLRDTNGSQLARSHPAIITYHIRILPEVNIVYHQLIAVYRVHKLELEDLIPLNIRSVVITQRHIIACPSVRC